MEDTDNITWEGLSKPHYVAYSSIFLLTLDTTLHPLDLIKTRQQYETSVDGRKASTLRQLASSILRNEGVKGLYRGYTVATLGSIPGQIVYFGGFEVGKFLAQKALDVSEHEKGQQGRVFVGNLFAGFFADLVSLVALTPSDVISQKMMVSTYEGGRSGNSGLPSGLRDVVRNIYKSEGYLGFYRGYGGALMANAPASAAWFAVYESVKYTLHTHRAKIASLLHAPSLGQDSNDQTWKTSVHLVSGAVAGLAAAVVSNPFDVAKTRFQTLNAEHPEEAKILRNGYFGMLAQTIREEGLRGITRGLLIRIWFYVPGSALTFAGYELAKQFAKKEVV